jgi:hypothetical protein
LLVGNYWTRLYGRDQHGRRDKIDIKNKNNLNMIGDININNNDNNNNNDINNSDNTNILTLSGVILNDNDDVDESARLLDVQSRSEDD